jgi:hypothetical protein
MLVACGSSVSNSENPKSTDKRFETIYEQREGISYTKIIKDKETGKLYLWRKSANAGGLCQLDETK